MIEFFDNQYAGIEPAYYDQEGFPWWEAQEAGHNDLPLTCPTCGADCFRGVCTYCADHS